MLDGERKMKETYILTYSIGKDIRGLSVSNIAISNESRARCQCVNKYFAIFLWLNHALFISSSCKESKENLVEKEK